MTFLALVTDAFGGRGGIAKFNRDFLTALCEISEVERIIAYPRIVNEEIDSLPDKLVYRAGGINSKFKYIYTLIKDSFKDGKSDYLICAHINLLPFAYFLKLLGFCKKIILTVHGIEVWKKQSFFAGYFVQRTDLLISVSSFTLLKMSKWMNVEKVKHFILPNSIDLNQFSVREKNNDLIEKHDLKNKKIILTLGRLAGKERGKGFDQVLELMPMLLKADSTIRYIIAGDGIDRKRLEAKALSLGVTKEVVFTGYLEENMKADFYRLADLFVMVGEGEGFGIVYLEALACGTPAIGSILDGSQEALLGGELGRLVNPYDLEELMKNILEVLERKEKVNLELLECFSFSNFKNRVSEIFNAIERN